MSYFCAPVLNTSVICLLNTRIFAPTKNVAMKIPIKKTVSFVKENSLVFVFQLISLTE